MPDKPFPKQPDRPLECTECKKHIAIRYTEIVGDMMTQTSMCADCPELKRRLFGGGHPLHPGSHAEAGLACGNCGTTLESVRMGTPLGCSICYDVFDEMILSELHTINKIPARLATAKKATPIHLGRSPGKIQEINPSMRLLALNEALTETLKREDYEQAALLRDQIKAITDDTEKEKQHDK